MHVDDIAGAAWACAEWIAPKGRAAANAAAGEKITFHNDKNKVKDVEGSPPHNQTVIAPIFNIVRSGYSWGSVSMSTLTLLGRRLGQYHFNRSRTYCIILQDQR